MNISRKEFLKTTSLIAGGMILPAKLFSRILDEPINFKNITDNIGIYTERGGTIGWLVSNNGVVVIDSQFPDTAKNFMAGLLQKTSRKIDILFNTHHHGDHTSGNIYLKDFSKKIVAHENCKMFQEKNDKKDPNNPQAYADTTFTETWSEDLGKEKVTAKYFGPAHTGGDAVIHFEQANIAHVGDLVFNQTFPYIDANGGGAIQNWPIVLEKVMKHYSKDTKFIYGHAISNDLLVGSIEDLNFMKNYFYALIEFVNSEIKKGKTKDEIMIAAAIPGFENLKERREGMRKMNLERAYDELSKLDNNGSKK
jgi:cyclase